MIDQGLYADYKESKQVHKILLLGTGESGKSTFFKQMQLLYDTKNKGLSKDFSSFGYHICARDSIIELVHFVERLGLTFENQNSEAAAERLLQINYEDSACFINPEYWRSVLEDINHLWRHEPVIKTAYRKRNDDPSHQASMELRAESAAYFFAHTDRICTANYLPTSDDYLRVRIKTTGIIETKEPIHIRGVKFKFIDVGGQRNERRKWIRCFDNVTAIIFIVGVSEFDQFLYEDSGVNCLQDSMDVWRTYIIDNKDFRKEMAYILFLNKVDLFEDKLVNGGKSLRSYFPDFDGPDTVQDSLKFLEDKFLSLSDSDMHIYVHWTTATDSDNVSRVFLSCRDSILKHNIMELGLGDME